MAEDNYYVRFRGRTLGPFNEQKTRELIKRGRVTRMHELSPDGVSWQQANAFPELFGPTIPQESATQQAAAQTEQSESPDPQPPADSTTWYAHINDENKGPVTKQQIGQWVASGSITEETLVWQEGTEDWEPANIAIPDLFTNMHSAAQSFSAAHQLEPTNLGTKPCPLCAQMINASAIKCPHCQSMLNNFCSNCGNQCSENQAVCLNCGTAINNDSGPVMIAEPANMQGEDFVYGSYNKTTAAVLAFLIGGLGAHKFYHGSIGYGIVYIVFCPTFIPAIISLIEAIVYLSMSNHEYDEKYNYTPPNPFKW